LAGRRQGGSASLEAARLLFLAEAPKHERQIPHRNPVVRLLLKDGPECILGFHPAAISQGVATLFPESARQIRILRGQIDPGRARKARSRRLNPGSSRCGLWPPFGNCAHSAPESWRASRRPAGTPAVGCEILAFRPL